MTSPKGARVAYIDKAAFEQCMGPVRWLGLGVADPSLALALTVALTVALPVALTVALPQPPPLPYPYPYPYP